MSVRWNTLFSRKSAEWSTPTAMLQALDAEFNFTLDPCPAGGKTDGLSPLFCPWEGQRVFCNPPYGPGSAKWLARWSEAQVAVYLLPARTDVAWFHGIVLPHASEIRFVRGRLRFGTAKHGAPFPSVIVIFDNRP